MAPVNVKRYGWEEMVPVAALAPYEYTSMIWALGLGYAMFGQVPSWTTMAGAVVVVAAGLYNLWREQRRRRVEHAASAALAMPGPALAQRNDQ